MDSLNNDANVRCDGVNFEGCEELDNKVVTEVLELIPRILENDEINSLSKDGSLIIEQENRVKIYFWSLFVDVFSNTIYKFDLKTSKQKTESSKNLCIDTKIADTTVSTSQLMRDYLTALDHLYREKQNLFDKFEDERHSFFQKKLDEFMAKTFLKPSKPDIYSSYRKIYLSEYSFGDITSPEISLDKLEIVETPDSRPTADFDSFFDNLIEDSDKLNEETDLRNVCSPSLYSSQNDSQVTILNSNKVLFKNLNTFDNNCIIRKFNSDYSINRKRARYNMNLIENSQHKKENTEFAKKNHNKFGSTLMSEPREWYSANSVMELSDRYIAHFEENKNAQCSGDLSKRELKNYRLIKAYLKMLDSSEDELLNDKNNINQLTAFNNYSMPELNWSQKITERAIQIVKNNLENFNNVRFDWSLKKI